MPRCPYSRFLVVLAPSGCTAIYGRTMETHQLECLRCWASCEAFKAEEFERGLQASGAIIEHYRATNMFFEDETWSPCHGT